jgi:hypothetical protein
VQDEDRETSRGEVEEQLKALGYIDPGAGSSIWQMILARWFRLAAGLRKLLGRPRKEDEE